MNQKTIYLSKALLIGALASIITGFVMVMATKMGMSPFPKPPSLAFASKILGHPIPLMVGLLFHFVYVTFWGTVFAYLFKNRLTFLNATWLGLFLWIVLLLGVFPFVGWGFLGLSIGPKLIMASFIPHALFVLIIWLGARWLMPKPDTGTSETA